MMKQPYIWGAQRKLILPHQLNIHILRESHQVQEPIALPGR
jgi:hypothetical protein